MNCRHLLLVAGALAAFAAPLTASSIADHYQIEDIATPEGLDAQVGGLAFSPSGRLFAAFHRGEVYSYDPASRQWTLYASGLHEPLGLVAISDREVVVAQRPELTRLVDSDGDGVADDCQTICDSFGLSGNYHEFAFGPAIDPKGDFIIGLNVASNGAKIAPEIRGEFRHYGVSREDILERWTAVKTKVGRMYSAVPYRGWIVKIGANDGKLTPIACGVRSPNGLGYDAAGHLLVTDNQGDWLGSSKLFDIRQGEFYGHPASLVWREGWDKRNPLTVPVMELDRLRTRESVMFPQDLMANSPTQPLLDTTGGKFGPYAGQVFVGEMNIPRIMRVLLEEVGGRLQGACVPFYDKAKLRAGNNRFAFDRAGAMWVGQTHLSWAGGVGIQKITWKGTVPMDVLAMNLTNTGFNLRFTKPLKPETAAPAAFVVRRYYYQYHEAYGSKQLDERQVTVTSAALSKDGTSVALVLDEMKPGYQYEVRMKTVAASDGETVINPLVIYTVNTLLDGTKAPIRTPVVIPPKKKKGDKADPAAPAPAP